MRLQYTFSYSILAGLLWPVWFEQALFASYPARQHRRQACIAAPGDRNRTPGSAACARRLFQDGKQTGPCCLGAAAWLKPPTKQALSAWVSPARTQHKSSPSSPALEFWKENGRGERDACGGYGLAHHTTRSSQAATPLCRAAARHDQRRHGRGPVRYRSLASVAISMHGISETNATLLTNSA